MFFIIEICLTHVTNKKKKIFFHQSSILFIKKRYYSEKQIMFQGNRTEFVAMTNCWKELLYSNGYDIITNRTVCVYILDIIQSSKSGLGNNSNQDK